MHPCILYYDTTTILLLSLVDGIVAHNAADLSAAENAKSGAELEKEETSLKVISKRMHVGNRLSPSFIPRNHCTS